MRRYNIDKSVFNSLYTVTNNGCVFRKKDGYHYSPCKDRKGHYRLRLPYPNAGSKDGRLPFKVHRLVAMFYLDDYSEELQVNHKNGVKTDNRVENLEMVTNRENVLHAWRVLDSTERKKKLVESIKRHYAKRTSINSLQL